ncbi:hypothetical protein EDC94DRAFT_595637 [Helicostylum pulchrum]|uniref:peptidylprolyl isomerase n=1 Tax=Helicostylum pulchrum TaxID=562976 RepID=A0ABP9XLV3_9FUNG|nr:hypothetical protein EDC94DRAFT_595637 [Helicostylum pulchrum]
MKTPQENFDQGVKLRLAGNEDFKKQDYKGALTNYYNALLHLKAVGGQKYKDQYKSSSEEQLVMIYNNMSAVFARQERWDRVLFYATKANELDSTNTKSKFRMGQAYLQLENIEKAKELLEEVMDANPTDTLVKKELQKVAAASKQMDDKEKLVYRAMMTKLAQEKK